MGELEGVVEKSTRKSIKYCLQWCLNHRLQKSTDLSVVSGGGTDWRLVDSASH